MSFLDIFKTTPDQQAPQQQVPGQQPAQQTAPGPAPAGNIPPNTDPNAAPAMPVVDPNAPVVDPNAPIVPDSPLAEFKDLWEPVPIDPNAPPATEPPPALTTEAVQKAVAKADFSQAINAETMAAITAGGEGAGEAFAKAMNAVAQQVMVQSVMANNKLTEKAVAEAVNAYKKDIPGLLREQATKDHLVTTNPLFDNPAIKPVIEATRLQILQKFPNATNEQISEMTNNYILAMGEAFAPAPVTPEVAGETDWSKYLG